MTGINRRSVLKGISTASGSLVTARSVAASRSESETGSVDVLLEKPGVKLLLDEVGSVEIDHESRRTSVLELSDGSVYSTTSVEMTLGTLVHSEFDDGDQQESCLVLDDSPNHPYRKERNRSVKRSAENRRKTWPQNTEAALVVRDGSLRFIRDATRNELVALGKVVGKQHSEIEAIVDGDEADYRVFSMPSEGDASKSTVYAVDLETESVLSERVVDPKDDGSGASIQHHNRNECLYNFGACLWSLALPPGCKSCGLLCKASKISGWAGYAACFVCLSHICGVALYDLYGCYNAAKCVDHWNIV